jgi:HEPN domain-containing protein
VTERPDSPYAEDWLKVARRDWHRIHVLLADGDADGAGFFLQQALERYLKAFLLSQGWKLKKVHTLQSLLDEAAAFMPDLSALRPVCERVSGFYIGGTLSQRRGRGIATRRHSARLAGGSVADHQVVSR